MFKESKLNLRAQIFGSEPHCRPKCPTRNFDSFWTIFSLICCTSLLFELIVDVLIIVRLYSILQRVETLQCGTKIDWPEFGGIDENFFA